MTLIRHATLGVALAIYGVVGLWSFVKLGLPYPVALLIVHLSAVSVAYPVSSRWVFRKPILTLRKFFEFHVSYALQFPVSLIALALLIEVFEIRLVIAQALAMATASVTNFVMLRSLVFKKPALT